MSADSDQDISPPTKKISSKKPTETKNSSKSQSPLYDAKELASLSHADLIAHAIDIQQQLENKPVAVTAQELLMFVEVIGRSLYHGDNLLID